MSHFLIILRQILSSFWHILKRLIYEKQTVEGVLKFTILRYRDGTIFL